jgi:hypothetical protein
VPLDFPISDYIGAINGQIAGCEANFLGIRPKPMFMQLRSRAPEPVNDAHGIAII